MKFEFNNDVPIYIQLVEQIKIYIISGNIKSGERLPSVRELAMMSKVNPNTMQKALAELEDLGLIFTERTNGKYVTKDAKLISRFKTEYAIELTKRYYSGMESIGFDKTKIFDFLKDNKGDL